MHIRISGRSAAFILPLLAGLLQVPTKARAQDRAELEKAIRAQIEEAARGLAEVLEKTVLDPAVHERFASQISEIVTSRYEGRLKKLEESLAEKDKRIAELEKQLAGLLQASKESEKPAAEPAKPTNAFLGVSHIEDPKGAKVTAILPQSPAEAAGIQEGDIITKLAGTPVTSPELSSVVTRHEPGSEIEITILRNGDENVLRAKLANREEFAGRQAEPANTPSEPLVLGIVVDDTDGTVKVAEVEEGLTGSVLGIQTGDVVIGFNGKEIASIDTLVPLVRSVKAGEEFSIHVRRGEAKLEIRGVAGAGKGTAKLLSSREVKPETASEEKKPASSEAKPAYFGVEVVESGDGVVVENVLPGTGAAASDLRRGDVIKKVNGRDVRTIKELQEILGSLHAGDEIPVVLGRDGADVMIEKLRLGARDEPVTEVGAEEASAKDGKPAFLGISAFVDPLGMGVVVSDVLREGPAGAAGLESGDIVVRFADRSVTDLRSLTDAISRHRPGDIVRIVLRRGDRDLEVDVTLAERG